MGFTDAVRSVFNKYVTIEGRARRSEYWYFVLFCVLVGLVAGMIDGIAFAGNEMTPVSSLFSLAVLIPSVTVGIRRLHDRDMSGWWMLLMLVPLIGTVILLVLFILKGTDGPNRFGPDPLGGTGDDWAQPDEETYGSSSFPKVDRD